MVSCFLYRALHPSKCRLVAKLHLWMMLIVTILDLNRMLLRLRLRNTTGTYICSRICSRILLAPSATING